MNQVLLVPMISHLLNPKLIVIVILTLEFHGRQVLIEKRSVRNRPSKHVKTRGGISNQGRTIRTRGGIQTIVELSEQEEAFQTVGKEP